MKGVIATHQSRLVVGKIHAVPPIGYVTNDGVDPINLAPATVSSPIAAAPSPLTHPHAFDTRT